MEQEPFKICPITYESWTTSLFHTKSSLSRAFGALNGVQSGPITMILKIYVRDLTNRLAHLLMKWAASLIMKMTGVITGKINWENQLGKSTTPAHKIA